MKQVKFYLEDEYYQILKQRAEEKGVSISSLVREMVLKELELLEENSLEKRVSKLENAYKKVVEALKRHRAELNDLYNCCSQVNYYWAMNKRAQGKST